MGEYDDRELQRMQNEAMRRVMEMRRRAGESFENAGQPVMPVMNAPQTDAPDGARRDYGDNGGIAGLLLLVTAHCSDPLLNAALAYLL